MNKNHVFSFFVITMYIHLVSNASNDVFPNNTLSNFANVLGEPLSLIGDYEVGLSEIHIPCCVDMLEKKDAWFEIIDYIEKNKDIVEGLENLEDSSIVRKQSRYEVRLHDDYAIMFKKKHHEMPEYILGNRGHVFYLDEFEKGFVVYRSNTKVDKILINGGFYKKISNLLEEINKNAKDAFKLTEDEHVVCTSTKDGPFVVRFSEQLANILGFRDESIQFMTKGASVRARYETDRYPGTNFFLISSDFIGNSRVGDTCVPLLRAVAFNETETNEMMTYACFPVQYVKVLLHEVSSIRITITDDAGREVPFQNRKRVFATLQFRHKRSDGEYIYS